MHTVRARMASSRRLPISRASVRRRFSERENAPKCSCASRLWRAAPARWIRRATFAASRSSSKRTRAIGISLAITSLYWRKIRGHARTGKIRMRTSAPAFMLFVPTLSHLVCRTSKRDDTYRHICHFTAPNLVVKTCRSFSRFVERMNGWFQGCPPPACLAGMLWEAGICVRVPTHA